MYPLIRPLLFRLDPERAHHLTLRLLRFVGAVRPLRAAVRIMYASPRAEPVEAFGLRFSNPVGLAAGYDKDGLAWRGLASLGFGHLEIGTVTLRPQDGNLRPRLFRLPEHEALINRLGFPGRGGEAVRRSLAGERPAGLVLGVNIGLNKDTPLDQAAGDYLRLLELFAPLADYLVINVSSPNTVGLRRLQARRALEGLLRELVDGRNGLGAEAGGRTPLLVKLSPDLSDADLSDAVEVALEQGLDGVVATNTTIGREGLTAALAHEVGGLSGAPLRRRSTAVVAEISRLAGGRLPIIAVGGVSDAASAREKLEAGASLVQIYTGLIYQGPGVVKQIIESTG
ncbi:MAG: quinone-dependent dihydroorotate dehydrogenase [Anaerolineales bacterium]|nr:quinone-dependent dihydroorotate dehydrogenase [Anaerolineales bacterium]